MRTLQPPSPDPHRERPGRDQPGSKRADDPAGAPTDPGRPVAPKAQLLQILAAAVVLALFVFGVVIAGSLGALLVGILAVGAGGLLALRWGALHERVRIFRAVMMLICVAVAISLL